MLEFGEYSHCPLHQAGLDLNSRRCDLINESLIMINDYSMLSNRFLNFGYLPNEQFVPVLTFSPASSNRRFDIIELVEYPFGLYLVVFIWMYPLVYIHLYLAISMCIHLTVCNAYYTSGCILYALNVV